MPLRTRTLWPGFQIVAFLLEPPEHSNFESKVQITHLEWNFQSFQSLEILTC